MTVSILWLFYIILIVYILDCRIWQAQNCITHIWSFPAYLFHKRKIWNKAMLGPLHVYVLYTIGGFNGSNNHIVVICVVTYCTLDGSNLWEEHLQMKTECCCRSWATSRQATRYRNSRL